MQCRVLVYCDIQYNSSITVYPNLAVDEPNAPEPVNTMDLGNTFNQLILKKDEEEEQVEFVEQSEIRLMLFPSQIRKIGSLIALLAYYRDLLQRYLIFTLISLLF